MRWDPEAPALVGLDWHAPVERIPSGWHSLYAFNHCQLDHIHIPFTECVPKNIELGAE